MEWPSPEVLGSYAFTFPRMAWSQWLTWHGVQRPSLFALRCNTCSWGATPAPCSLRDQAGARHQLKPPLYLAYPLSASPAFPRASPESILSIDHLDKNPCLRLCCPGISPKTQKSSVRVSVSLDKKWGIWVRFYQWVYFTNTDCNIWVSLHTLYQDIQVSPFSILSLSYILQREVSIL